MSTPVPIIPEEKPVIADSVTITGIFASSSISKNTGHQTIMILSGGKPSKLRNFYSDPSLSRVVSGSQVTVTAYEVEWLMSDFNGINYGSRRVELTPVKSVNPASFSGSPAIPEQKKSA